MPLPPPRCSAEVLIAGGGLAGAAAAIQLARAGRAVTLLERSTAPSNDGSEAPPNKDFATAHHKVCGEFLSAEALNYLTQLGVDVAALGAVPIDCVSLAGVTRPLPFRAMSLTRARLDEELLRLAAAGGATILRGQRVQSLAAGVDGWSAQLENGDSLHARAAFLATGKHDLRGHPRPQGTQPGLVGFKMYLRLTAAQTANLRGRVELLLYRGGYAGLQPVEQGLANLCCLIDRHELQRLGGRWEHLLHAIQQQCPELAERLAGAEPLLPRPLAITPIPYGYVRPPRQTEPGLWALGDQAAVIPSFTGDGMSIALHTGCLAAQMYLQGKPSAAYQHRLRQQLTRQVALATILSRTLIHPATRALVTNAVALFPTLLTLIANQTRIPPTALQHLDPAASFAKP